MCISIAFLYELLEDGHVHWPKLSLLNMDQNKGELLCRMGNRVSALPLEHNGGDVRIKNKLKRILKFSTGEESNRAGGRIHSMRDV